MNSIESFQQKQKKVDQKSFSEKFHPSSVTRIATISQ